MKKALIIILIFATALVARQVTFKFTPNISAEMVNLAGSFNGWSTDATDMIDPDGDGTWEVTIDLPDGEYQYKFVVNGETWVQDPNNPKGAPDGFGGQNSVIVVGDWDKFLGPAERGDGIILASALWHEQEIPYLCDDGDGTLWIRLRAKKGDVEYAEILFREETGVEQTVRMPYLCAEKPLEYFEIGLPFDGKIDYRFHVVDREEEAFFPEDGEFSVSPGEAPLLYTPDWAKGALFYQIFPERFANGDPTNDPENSVPWGSKPEYDNFMGGDLAGVVYYLPYLDSLGVDAIYFNPIFEAGSNHKYDTHDYYSIDDNFGDEQLFVELDAEMENLGMKIVLDGVFNHIGFGSDIFQDVVKKGAESEYADWFFIHDYPVHGPENPNYEAWWGFGSLPKMNTDNPEVREYLFGAIRHWLERGGDGWRLDVAPDVPHRFWKAFRDTIRAVDSDAYSVGEIWGDGTPWLDGSEFDAVMNYRFRDACIEFFGKSNISPEDFMDRLGGYLADYAQPSNVVEMNLLGSHDTPRFLTIAGEESWRLRLALFWALIWPGSPCVYYGDEIGMTGGKDPGCRKAFPWLERESWDTETLQKIRYVSNLRAMNPCLRYGSARPFFMDNEKKVLVIERRFGDEMAIAGVNLSGEDYTVSVDLFGANKFAPANPSLNIGRATEAFGGKNYYDINPLEFEIPAEDCVLFLVK